MDVSQRRLRCVVVEDDDAVRTVIALALRDYEVEARDFANPCEVLDRKSTL